MKINSISVSSKHYPTRLTNIPDKPLRLYLRGTVPDASPAVAIVGTRKPTPYGRQVTTELVEGLVRRGVTIISGMAIGVDGIAHEAALGVGGKTIAVLACGLDKPYPARHSQLALRIIEEGGALISEYEPGTPGLQFRLLARNRLVTGLSDALIVTEATLRSGTMNTVSHALSQGRDVYAVPGPITSPTSAGCNHLISQGAQPITSVEAFIDELAPVSKEKQATLLAHTEEEQKIIDLLRSGISDGGELLVKSRLTPTQYQQTMTMLELRAVIKPLGGNHWSL